MKFAPERNEIIPSLFVLIFSQKTNRGFVKNVNIGIRKNNPHIERQKMIEETVSPISRPILTRAIIKELDNPAPIVKRRGLRIVDLVKFLEVIINPESKVYLNQHLTKLIIK